MYMFKIRNSYVILHSFSLEACKTNKRGFFFYIYMYICIYPIRKKNKIKKFNLYYRVMSQLK